MSIMSKPPPEIQFFFQPFSAVEYKADTPVLCVVFESQSDMILANSFPEVEKARCMLDNVRDRGDETVVLFGGSRNDKNIPLGIVYVRQPWRRRRGQANWDIDSVNFYRELWERTALAVKRVRGTGYTELILVLPSQFQPKNIRNDRLQEQRLQKFVRTVTEAIVYANHSLDELVSDAPPLIKSATLIYFGEEDREVNNFFQRSIGEGQAIGEETGFVRQLTLLPSNLKYPLQFVARVTGANPKPRTTRSKIWRRLKGHHFSARTKVSYIYGKEGLERAGFGLVHAVGRGSVYDPLILKVHYRPLTDRQKPVKKVVLVGKGITFDTGGTNAKINEELDRMHYDMEGAAVAIRLVKLAEKMDLPVELVAITPVAENINGPFAGRTQDVVKAYDGKTIQVIDTDCEGRIVLADAVAYAERYLKADCTITIGTLGDMTALAPDLVKVGFGNNKLIRKILRAENASAEKITLLPSIDHLNEVYNEHQGDVSDLLNWPKGGYYHSSPFVFLYHFFNEERPQWVFVDPSALFESDADNYGAGPGFGLKFIWYLIKQYA